MKRILVFGSTCVDIIIRLPHLPSTGEDIEPSYQHFSIGGCACNVAHIGHSLGVPLTFVTPVGTGMFGDYVWHHLTALGLSGPVRVPDRDNGCCYCYVEDSGERTFLAVHGAEYTFDPAWFDQMDTSSFDYAYISGFEVEEPTGPALIDFMSYLRAETVYAPNARSASIDRRIHEAVYRLHPILHINESEAYILSGLSRSACTPEEAASALYQRTGNTVIVTRGAKGTLWAGPDGSLHRMYGRPAKVADTIGAGDSHAGSVLAGLSMEWPLEDCMKLATLLSSATVSIEGGQLPADTIRRLFTEMGRKTQAEG